MSQKKADEFLTLLYMAQAEPIGLLVATNDFERLRQRLYTARRNSGDASLAALQVRASPFEGGELIIVHSSEKKEKES